MLTITLLGTAATMPLPDRALSTAFAACGGHGLLFDCGEGTQAAARRAGVNLMRADAVCLTHYHGDHIFGLPGLLQTLGAQGRTRPLLLVGPKGLAGIWSAVRALTGPLPYAVRLQEADGPLSINLITRMIKTTSLVLMIGVVEVLKVSQQIIEANRTASPNAAFGIYLTVFVLYFFACWPISLLASYLEKKWK